MNLHSYIAGRNDCIDGFPARSSDAEYHKGYGDAYAQEQRVTAFYLMEPIYVELSAMEEEIDALLRMVR